MTNPTEKLKIMKAAKFQAEKENLFNKSKENRMKEFKCHKCGHKVLIEVRTDVRETAIVKALTLDEEGDISFCETETVSYEQGEFEAYRCQKCYTEASEEDVAKLAN